MARLHGGKTETVSEAADDLAEIVGIALLRFLFEATTPDFTQLALRDAEAPTSPELGPAGPNLVHNFVHIWP
ncbi:MAG: hypothetical protein WKF78_13860 [Candidatus Limnocylindrales bacterium]